MSAPYQYVVLHASLRDHLGAIAVHAAHAAGEACVNGPAPSDTHVVVLEATVSEALKCAAEFLRERGIPHALIVETDGVRAGQATALGVVPGADREIVREVLNVFKVFR